MKNTNINIFSLLLFFIFLPVVMKAQVLTGSTTVAPGEVVSYSIRTSKNIRNINGYATVSGGTIISSEMDCGQDVQLLRYSAVELAPPDMPDSGGEYPSEPASIYCYMSLVVEWGSGSNGVITFNGSLTKSWNITISGARTPASTLSVQSSNCGNSVLSYSGSPPAGETWYWQTTSTGTDMSASDSTWTVYNSSTYFLRSRNNVSGVWSTGSVSISITVKTSPSIGYIYNSGGTTIASGGSSNISVYFSSGITVNWSLSLSGVTTNGSTSGSNSSSSFSVSNQFTNNNSSNGTATYTFTPTQNGCSGTSQTITVTVTPGLPAIPNPIFSTVNNCGSSTISYTVTPPSGTTWYWQDNSLGTSMDNSTNSIILYPSSSSLDKFVRAYRNGQWSTGSAAAPRPTIISLPSFTASLSSSNSICSGQTVTLTTNGTIGANINIWYTSSGINISGDDTDSYISNGSNHSVSQTLTIDETSIILVSNRSQQGSIGKINYMISAIKNGCSSSTQKITVTVKPVPTVSVTNSTCVAYSGNSFSFSPSTNILGASIQWAFRGTNIVNVSGSGSGNTISVSPILTSASANWGYWDITSTAEGCTSPTKTVAMILYPPVSIKADTNGNAVTLSANSNTSGDYAWTNSAGTNLSSTSSYAPSTQDVYTLTRTMNNPCAGTKVSSSSSYYYIQTPSTSVTQTGCSPRLLTCSSTPPAGVTWYWQTTTDGTSKSYPSTQSYPAYSSGTYYLRAAAGDSWSGALAVSVTTVSPPTVVVNPAQTLCGPQRDISLTLNNNTGGVSNTWTIATTNLSGASSGNGVSGSSSPYVYTINQSISLISNNSSGRVDYTFTPTKDGCSGTPVTTSITLNPIPTFTISSSSGTASSYGNGSRTICDGKGNVQNVEINLSNTNNLSNVQYIWTLPVQSSVIIPHSYSGGGPSTATTIRDYVMLSNAATDGAIVYNFTASAGGCSSSSSSISFYVKGLAAAPPIPTVSMNPCGSRTLTFSGTPPSGVTWYWQWTWSTGTIQSNSSNSFTADIAGTNTYYLRSKDSNCWGESTGVLVTVNPIPSPPPPQATIPTFCEADAANATLTVDGTSMINWYLLTPPSSTPLSSSPSYTPSVKDIGSYSYLAKLVTNGCESATGTPYSINIVSCDQYMNWQESIGYTYSSPTATTPVEATHSKTYQDGFGTTIQSQIRVASANQVIATESIYDRLGVQALSTLPAPINSSGFGYRNRFTLNISNEKFSWRDYDSPPKPPGSNPFGEINNPGPVLSGLPGTLGWYYSVLNTLEPNTPTTSYPYMRSYSPPGPDPRSSQSAGPDALRMGGGHTSKTDKYVITSTELSHYYSLRALHFNSSSFPVGGKTSQQVFAVCSSTYCYTVSSLAPISVLPGTLTHLKVVNSNSSNGTAIFTIIDGNDASKQYLQSVVPVSPNEQTILYTIPSNVTSIKAYLSFPSFTPTDNPFVRNLYPYYTATFSIQLATINPQNMGYKTITTDADGKQAAVFTDADGHTVATARVASVSGTPPNQTYTYDNWSYTYYNDMGQVVATVSPQGVNTSSIAYPSYVTTYRYDHMRRLIETTSPDEGTSQFLYSLDGKIRFSQNQEQRNAAQPRFSYTNYDYLGRLIEGGEYTKKGATDYTFDAAYNTASPNSVQSLVDNIGYTGVTAKTGNADNYRDVMYIDYDVPTDDFVADALHPKQNNLLGNVSRTKNASGMTWYSYDEFGNVEWTMQQTGLGVKTVDYTYDFLGNVLTVAYQKGQADALWHHYTYDADGRLINTTTSLDGNTQTQQAAYKYYLHGPLKRMELASNLQGIDYVYTIEGMLKGINHPDAALDPGRDGVSGTPNASFSTDKFGLSLNYRSGDYSGANYNAGSLTATGNNSYTGLPKAAWWRTPVDQQNLTGMKMWAYSYDNLNRFSSAQWGTVQGSGGSYTGSTGASYQESIGNYDANGNILSLNRKNKSGSTTAAYTYTYKAGTNQLSSVSGSNTSYEYNAIGQLVKQTVNGKTWTIAYNAYGLTQSIRDGDNNLIEEFFYDDRGDLCKKAYYNAGTFQKSIWYVRDASGSVLAIYEQKNNIVTLLEQPIYGIGRIGVMKRKSNTPQCFYELTDHLGNVRTVIGPPSTVTYQATMEAANATTEDKLFSNTIAPRVVSTAANSTPNGNSVVRLNNTRRVGPGIVLKVSPGDNLSASVTAYYEGGSGYNNMVPIATMASAVAAAFTGTNLVGEANKITNAFSTTYNTTGFAGITGDGNDNVPKAYLNLIMFDNNFNVSPTTLPMSAIPITSAANFAKQTLTIPALTIPTAGYVYIYVDNASDSPNWVYFDDLSITHVKSPYVAGGDFYPFGLPIDDRQITTEPYRYGYQGQFAEYDSLQKKNQFELRLYDPDIGRWLSPDPYGQFPSPYVGMGNNPIMGVDPDGGSMIPVLPILSNPEFQLMLEMSRSGMVLSWSAVSVTATRIATSTEYAINAATSILGAVRFSTNGYNDFYCDRGSLYPSGVSPRGLYINQVLDNPSGGSIREQDNYGSGHYEAPRDGNTRKHRGIDITTNVGQDLVSPVSGVAVNYIGESGKPIVDITPTVALGGVNLIRILYVHMPNGAKERSPYNVIGGRTLIGTAADLEVLGYPVKITPHIHVQVRIGKRWINPTPYFFGPN